MVCDIVCCFFIGFYETPLLFVILCWGLVVCPIMFCAGTMVQHLLWRNVVWSMLFVIIIFKWKFVLCWNCVEIGCARTVILHNFLSMMACGNCKKVLPVCSLRILTFCPHHLVALILGSGPTSNMMLKYQFHADSNWCKLVIWSEIEFNL